MSTVLFHLDPGLPPALDPDLSFVWGFSGWAWRPDARLIGVTVVVGDANFPAHTVDGFRLDAEAAGAASPFVGFWGVAILPAGRHQGTIALSWSNGERDTQPFAIAPVDQAEPVPVGVDDDAALVVIAMATYNPDPALFAAQITSIRQQSYRRWLCLVEDDGSDDAHWAMIAKTIADDRRFVARRNAVNLGFYRNFERALTRVPPDARYVAFADQDDRWAPDRVAAEVAALINGADGQDRLQLVFGNMRVVDHAGQVMTATFWPGIDSRHDSLEALLMANAVTGCATMFDARLLRLALPFPGFGRVAYHDHWLACCAAASGRIGYLSQSLGDYVQHGANSLGYRRRPGWRLAIKLAAALIALPAVAVAAQFAGLRRRLARPLDLLIGLPEAEMGCRAAFAEALVQRTAHRPDAATVVRAVAVARAGAHPVCRLLAAVTRPAPRGRAFRGAVARLAVGLMIGSVARRLARKIARPGGGGAGG